MLTQPYKKNQDGGWLGMISFHKKQEEETSWVIVPYNLEKSD